jgi:hypothetical protein
MPGCRNDHGSQVLAHDGEEIEVDVEPSENTSASCNLHATRC